MRIPGGVLLAAALLAGGPAWAQEKAAKVAQAKWDAEAKELIPKIVESNLDLGSSVKHFHSMSCEIGVRIVTNLSPRPMAAAMSYGWEDRDDNGLLSPDEVDVETTYVSDRAIGVFMRGLADSLRRETTASVFNIFGKHDVTTRKVPAGYILELRPIGGAGEGAYDRLYLSVAADGRVTGLQARGTEGGSLKAEYDYVRFGDKWLRSGQRTRATGPGGESSEEARRDVYRDEGGVPVLASSTIDLSVATGGNVVQMRQEFTVENLKTKRRPKPLPAPGTVDYEKMFQEAAPGAEGPLVEEEPVAAGAKPKPPQGEGALFEDEPKKAPVPGDAGGLFEDEEPARPAAAAGESPELGAQAVKAVEGAYFAWLVRNPGGDFAGDLTLTEQGRKLATFLVSPTKIEVCGRVEVSENVGPLTAGLSYVWSLFVQGPLGLPKEVDRKWTARRTPTGCRLTARGPAGQLLDEATVQGEDVVTSRTIHVPGDADQAPAQFVLDFESRDAGGARYLRNIRMRQMDGDTVLLERNFVLTYQNLPAGVFLRRIDVSFRDGQKTVQGSFEVGTVE